MCPEQESNLHILTDTWPSTMPVYQFQHLGNHCDPSGDRTQGPNIKSVVLYQLS